MPRPGAPRGMGILSRSPRDARFHKPTAGLSQGEGTINGLFDTLLNHLMCVNV